MEPNELQTVNKLIVEYWRIVRSFENIVLTQLPDPRFKGIIRQAERKLIEVLEELELDAVSYSGQTYSPNLAVTVINLDEFKDTDNLRIEQMLEPTIIHKGKVVMTGKAVASLLTGEE